MSILSLVFNFTMIFSNQLKFILNDKIFLHQHINYHLTNFIYSTSYDCIIPNLSY